MNETHQPRRHVALVAHKLGEALLDRRHVVAQQASELHDDRANELGARALVGVLVGLYQRDAMRIDERHLACETWKIDTDRHSQDRLLKDLKQRTEESRRRTIDVQAAKVDERRATR